MPTYHRTGRFRRDWDRLTGTQQKRLRDARNSLVADLKEMEAGRRSSFRHSLRVKGVKGAPGIFEMTWAADGRATFEWGEEKLPGHRHIIWRRCGGHKILARP